MSARTTHRGLRGPLLRVVRPVYRGLRHGLTRLRELRARWSTRHVAAVLVLHAVRPEAGDPDRELLPAIAVSRLDAHLAYLRRRYRVVRAVELREAMCARRQGDRVPVAITFDDDLASHVEYVVPLLRRHAVRATFFLGGTSLAAPSAAWWQRLQIAADAGIEPRVASPTLVAQVTTLPSWTENPRSLPAWATAAEGLRPALQEAVAVELRQATDRDPVEVGLRAEGVQALLAFGMDIGFHTARHYALPGLTDDELRSALHDGRERLEQIVGAPLTLIAYPHGKVDARTAPAAREAGFRMGFTTTATPVTPTTDPLLLGRVAPSPRSTLDFAAQLAAVMRRSS